MNEETKPNLTSPSDTQRLLHLNRELEKLESRYSPVALVRTGVVALIVGFVSVRLWQVAASAGAGLEMGLILGIGLSLPVAVRIWEWRRIMEMRGEASELERALEESTDDRPRDSRPAE